jgi:putative ABC transport system permease protein
MKNVLAWLVHLFPEPFRERFGEAMVEHAAAELERARVQGRLAGLRSAAGSGWDLLCAALAERWRPTWKSAHSDIKRRKNMVGTLQGWTSDMRHGLRTLRRTPAFTATAVGTLGLAIGMLAGIYTVLDKVLLDPLPYREPQRLVAVAGTAPGSDLPAEFDPSVEFFIHYKEHSRQLEDVAAYSTFTATLRVGDRVERVRMGAVSSSLYSTLGAQPALGRVPAANEENVAVIGDAVWRSWFASDPAVIGRAYEMAGQKRTVVGVMAPEFAFPNDGALVWISVFVRFDNIRPGRFGANLVARMAPGATPESAATELTALARQLPERFGGSAAYARIIGQHRAVVRPLLDHLLGPATRLLWVLFAAGAIVLVIACANVANLFLVRAEGRQRDLAVRRAIGATRGELVRLQMAEAVVVAGLAGALAVALAWMSLPALLRAAPQGIPRLDEVAVGWTTLAFTALAAVLAATACGAAPALRGASPDLQRLRDGNRGSTGRRGWARDGLVAAQTALALVLLIGSGLLLRSFHELRNVDPGYDTRDVFTFQFAPDQQGLRDGPAWARFHLDFLDRLRRLPGVASVGLVENVPLNEGTRTARIRVEGSDPAPDAAALLHLTFAAGDYFRGMGIEILEGRPFATADHVATPGNVVVSRSTAKALWPGQSAIGRRLLAEGAEDWHTVVGVVEDVMQEGFRDTPEALVYFPLAGPKPTSWVITTPAYVVKTSRAEVIAPDVRALIREVAPEAPMYRVFTMEGLAADSMVELSFTTLTLGIVSALALFLGAVGLYGVLSYVVAGRTREIGVRMALGASAQGVRRMVVAQGARVVGLGIALGVLAALAATRTLGGLLFGVAPVDAPTYAAMSTLMLAIGLLASYVPARRASRVDPSESLRND